MLRPSSPRYHYDVAFNLVISVSTIAMYVYLARQERKATGNQGLAK